MCSISGHSEYSSKIQSLGTGFGFGLCAGTLVPNLTISLRDTKHMHCVQLLFTKKEVHHITHPKTKKMVFSTIHVFCTD